MKHYIYSSNGAGIFAPQERLFLVYHHQILMVLLWQHNYAIIAKNPWYLEIPVVTASVSVVNPSIWSRWALMVDWLATGPMSFPVQ